MTTASLTTATTEALRLTERINRIEPSATMAVVAEADKLRQQGIDVVDFGAGEPHFATPQHIKDAAIAAIQGNFTKYTAVAGTAELRDAIAHRHNVDFDSDYRREEVIASTGGKHALFNAIQVLVDHGDEVILPVPYWVSFKDIIRYAGGNCVLLDSDEAQGFRVTAEMVSQLITPRTKAIILNSPSNPSGAVMSAEDMTEVIRLAHQRGIWVLSDECYVYLNYTGKNFSVGALREYKERFVVLGSLSKTYAMTGWRLGYAMAPAPVVSAMAKLQSQSNVEPDVDCAEGCGGGAQGAAGVRGRDAEGVHPAARPCGEGAALDLRREVHVARGCVLCLSEHFVVPWAGRAEVGFRRGWPAVARSSRRDGSGRGLWHGGTHPRVVRHVEGRTGSRAGAHAEVLWRAVVAFRLRDPVLSVVKILKPQTTEDTECAQRFRDHEVRPRPFRLRAVFFVGSRGQKTNSDADELPSGRNSW